MILKLLPVLTLLLSPVKAAEPDYLRVVQNYASALLTHGRDKVGPTRSPLIATTLDRAPFGMIDRASAPEVIGVRDRERVMEGANPMHDQNLYQILYALSALTGDDQYADDADRTLSWFLDHCVNPTTSLFAWGEHMGWDFKQERYIRKIAGTLHEFSRPWVLWDQFYLLNPKVTFHFARGLWEHQIADPKTGNFSKHALYDQHGPMVNGDEPRHAGFYISTWATAYHETQDTRYLENLTVGTWSYVFAERRNRALDDAMEMLTGYMERRRSPETGAIPADSGDPISAIPWKSRLILPVDNLSLAVDLGWSALRVEPLLAADMKLAAARIDTAFLKLKHDPAGAGFVVGADIYTLGPYGPEESQRSRPWTDRGIQNRFRDYGAFVMRSHAAIANLCYARFKQTDLRPYHDLVIKTARWYLDADPKATRIGVPNVFTRAFEWVFGAEAPIYPRMMGQAIKLMLNAHELTGDRRYLVRADHFARWSIQTFVNDSPLPRASHRNDHYEAVTGGDALMMAILELWAVKADRWSEVELVWVDR